VFIDPEQAIGDRQLFIKKAKKFGMFVDPCDSLENDIQIE
jgi:hypothetical protein